MPLAATLLARVRSMYMGVSSLLRLPTHTPALFRGLPQGTPPWRASSSTIAAATSKPVFIYNVPGRTGANIDSATTLALARDIPNIAGIKEASGKKDQILEILAGRPEGFSVLSGNDDDTLFMMKNGADGVVSVASNIAPREMSSFVGAAADGRMDEAAAMEERLRELFRVLFIEPNPIPGKAAMARLGLMENSLRLPLVPATAKTEGIIAQTLEELWKK